LTRGGQRLDLLRQCHLQLDGHEGGDVGLGRGQQAVEGEQLRRQDGAADGGDHRGADAGRRARARRHDGGGAVAHAGSVDDADRRRRHRTDRPRTRHIGLEAQGSEQIRHGLPFWRPEPITLNRG
jgi:hypothetical protein